jgi:hypothetical protein
MVFAKPQFTREEVNAAGRLIAREAVQGPELDHALQVINNWRACHSFPLNTFQVNLRRASRKYDSEALVAQRVKRLPSIALKLTRFQRMKLIQMQDIGGCRAVLNTVANVESIMEYYIRESQIKHSRATMDDYIQHPQKTGYRGIHLVYRYVSDKRGGSTYNGLKIEIQLRSQYQHVWATAVETVGTFVGQALKSSMGENAWLRFFALMGSEIAIRERRSFVPDTPGDPITLREELSDLEKELGIVGRLEAYNSALSKLTQVGTRQDSHYYLLELDTANNQLQITGFRQAELELASDRYLDAEK